MAVTALLGVRGIGGVAAAQAAAVIHVQQQVGRTHSAVPGARSFAFYAALMAFFTVKFLPLLRTIRFLWSVEKLTRHRSSQIPLQWIREGGRLGVAER